MRSNITVFFEPGKEYLPSFSKEHRIHLIYLLPCYRENNVDRQRSKGSFNKSIRALRLLNDVGYAKDQNLQLDVVYNPQGAYLPSGQEALEKEYKQTLGSEYGIYFNRLITITNVPIKRSRNYLEKNGKYAHYLTMLKNNFNPHVVENIMCRIFLSVGYDGKLYDCDFNQALGWVLKDEKGAHITIDNLKAEQLAGKNIMVGEHCLSCTAGHESGCQGALFERQQLDSPDVCSSIEKKELVKHYYGTLLTKSADLKTNVCCSQESLAKEQKRILSMIEPEILNTFYGCGSPLPPALEGSTVLDLGCGTGRDAYLASYLVGPKGRVIGVDMTQEQLSIARKYTDSQTNFWIYKA